MERRICERCAENFQRNAQAGRARPASSKASGYLLSPEVGAEPLVLGALGVELAAGVLPSLECSAAGVECEAGAEFLWA